MSYLNTIRTVAFAENNHLIGVDELLYLGFEFILPGVVFDGRHFQGISVRRRRTTSIEGSEAKFERQIINNLSVKNSPSLIKRSKSTSLTSLSSKKYKAQPISRPVPVLLRCQPLTM